LAIVLFVVCIRERSVVSNSSKGGGLFCCQMNGVMISEPDMTRDPDESYMGVHEERVEWIRCTNGFVLSGSRRAWRAVIEFERRRKLM